MKWRVMVEVTGEDGAVTQHVLSEGERTEAGQGMGQGMGPGGGTGPMHQQMFGQLDANKDGVVSRQDFVDAPRGGSRSMTNIAKERRGARFDQFDTNKDGKLTPDEWGAGTPAKP